MSQPGNSTPKKHSKEVLEPYNIFYVESLCKDGKYSINDCADQNLLQFLGEPCSLVRECSRPLPAHVEWVRKNLVDFPIFESSANEDQDAAEVLQYVEKHFPTVLTSNWTTMVTSAYNSNSKAWLNRVPKHYLEVKEKALELANNGRNESEWQTFLAEKVFPKPSTTLQSDKSVATLQHIARVQGLLWTGSAWMRTRVSTTSPKCDMTFGFRVWKPNESLIEDGSGFSKKEFSFDNLQALSKLHQCHSMPLCRQDKRCVPVDEGLMAFPFAIAEFKRTEIPERRGRAEEKGRMKVCYCQANNAASISLSAFQDLWHAAGRDDDTIPPVLSFTCIGPMTMLWMTFSVTGKKDKDTGQTDTGHLMVPIFRGDLSTVLGAITVCKVYENILRWSLEELRPRLAELIRAISEGVVQDDPHSISDISKTTPKRPSARGASTDSQIVQPKVKNKLDAMATSRRRAVSADTRAAQPKAKMSRETAKGLCESLSNLSVSMENGTALRISPSRSEQHNSAADEEEEDPFCGGTVQSDNGLDSGEALTAGDTPSKNSRWNKLGLRGI